MKYRKKPIKIEAVKWNGTRFEDKVPTWIADAININMPAPNYDSKPTGGIMRVGNDIHISTLEGIMTAAPNDYIIKGVKGELYPCKSDIFEMTYELID